MLCLNETGDASELVRQARSVVADSSNKMSSLRLFTLEDATSSYRQLDNFGLKHRAMFDWLDEVFSRELAP